MYVTWYFAIAAYPFLTSDSVARRSYSSVGRSVLLAMLSIPGYFLMLDAFFFISHSPVRSRDRLVRTR